MTIQLTHTYCINCHAPRFNDGTYCHRCGEYPVSIKVAGRCRGGCGDLAVRFAFGLPFCGGEECRDVLKKYVELKAED